MMNAPQQPDVEVPQPNPARNTKIIVAALVAAVTITEVLAILGTLSRPREDGSHTVQYSISRGEGVLVAYTTDRHETARDSPAQMPWSYTTTLSDGDTYFLWARSKDGGTACSVSVDGVVVDSTNDNRICIVSGSLPASPEPRVSEPAARVRNRVPELAREKTAVARLRGAARIAVSLSSRPTNEVCISGWPNIDRR